MEPDFLLKKIIEHSGQQVKVLPLSSNIDSLLVEQTGHRGMYITRSLLLQRSSLAAVAKYLPIDA